MFILAQILFFFLKKLKCSNTNGLEPFSVPKLLRILAVFVVEKSISYKIVSEHFFWFKMHNYSIFMDIISSNGLSVFSFRM